MDRVFDKNPRKTASVGQVRQILQPPCKREPKLLRAFLSHSHDIFAQFLGFDDDREFALLFGFVHGNEYEANRNIYYLSVRSDASN